LNARSLRTLFESQGLRLVVQRSFGLGRDFVTLIDRVARRRGERGRTRDQPPADHAPGGWDVNRLVLAAEDACNRVLNLTGAGVGVEATFTRP
jgi:hypothetical protein